MLVFIAFAAGAALAFAGVALFGVYRLRPSRLDDIEHRLRAVNDAAADARLFASAAHAKHEAVDKKLYALDRDCETASKQLKTKRYGEP